MQEHSVLPIQWDTGRDVLFFRDDSLSRLEYPKFPVPNLVKRLPIYQMDSFPTDCQKVVLFSRL